MSARVAAKNRKASKKAGKAKTPASKASKAAAKKSPKGVAKAEAPARAKVTAEDMSTRQRDISISEFFTKNRHLLGFDNASRALLTSVKEAVDNSLDACEEGGILPDIVVRLEQSTDTRFRMTVEDNGPGIVKAQVPKVFGKLLYGSKFHRLRQSRGQQGIGISAAGMYGQLTTGQPVEVISKTSKGRPAYQVKLRIDTQANRPVIVEEETVEWDKEHGTSVSIEMEASYKGGKRSVDEYIQHVALSNPHVRLEYWPPGKKPTVYPRMRDELPPEAKEIKPHPYGVELGILIRMLQGTDARNVSSFLQKEFSRVSGTIAKDICKNARIGVNTPCKDMDRVKSEALYKGIEQTKIMSPPTNCLAPIGESAMISGLKTLLVHQHLAAEEKKRRKAEDDKKQRADKALAEAESKVADAVQSIQTVAVGETADEPDDDGDGDAPQQQVLPSTEETEDFHTGIISVMDQRYFVTACTRPPKVYRGNPFQVEAALAYGGMLPGDQLAGVYRFANRVPLVYQQNACAMTQSIVRTNWKSYDVDQSRGALPTAPLIVLVHIASVWVPFTSEAKEAVAPYDEIITELKYALQECGRRLARHIRRRRRIADAEKKQRYIVKYIPHIGEALRDILSLTDKKTDSLVTELTDILERSRKM